ncbi:peptidase U62 modulator of DNA gyrase [Haliangium ochraceum DSM 14365]|uniref:Peptidase U62 modulator of DNA gyrase n=1 Tax=Haliangium ochraceum (strain DSM 14365 / JCM 11303 / SMP-2) TaxID=502025 RepID=D0LQ93_HALO1|nr:peptidase U62 modulator of DNA gyrase [Haliangium ochraceum DSM 14365]
MRWLPLWAVVWLPLAGCPKPQTVERAPLTPIEAARTAPSLELPEVPARIDASIVEPLEGNTPAARSPLLDIMVKENQRWMDVLAKQESAPAYFLSYQVYDRRNVTIEADGGALVTDSDDSDRLLDVSVRVGSPRLDNRHPLSDEQQDQLNNPRVRRGIIPTGNDELAVRNHLWLETDRRYREAKQALGVVFIDRSVTAQDDSPPDFVHEKPEEFIDPIAELRFDKEAWIERLRACSRKAFRGVATRASCRVDFQLDTVYYVNSEGTVIQRSWPTAHFMVSVGVKADDGMPLSRLEQRFANRPEELPEGAELDTLIDLVTTDLNALHEAPVVDPYVGPAILEGRAAAVFFHEVFGHRIEGHRQKERTSGQTFASKVGERIMPPWLSVYDDPRIARLNGMPLNGFYRFDDEGVRAQRASLVEDGVLSGFILGRNPIEGFANSNGHGRKEPGRVPVSRQGNLVVEAARSLPTEELEAALIAEVKRQGKPFGMLFTDISGGFTNTTRFLPQAFKVNPVMAYRVYPDGRRELVRGVDIVGTPLTALGSIMAASREVETFNGICGAESGWVPVSASAPSMLLRSLEVERGFKGVDRPPVLPPPSLRRHGAQSEPAPSSASVETGVHQ